MASPLQSRTFVYDLLGMCQFCTFKVGRCGDDSRDLAVFSGCRAAGRGRHVQAGPLQYEKPRLSRSRASEESVQFLSSE